MHISNKIWWWNSTKNFLPWQQCQCPNVADDPPKFVSRTLHSIISLFHQTCQCTTIPLLHVILLFHRPVSFVFVVAVLGLFSLRISILVWPCWGCLVCMLQATSSVFLPAAQQLLSIIVIKCGGASEQTKFRVLRMDVSQEETRLAIVSVPESNF